VVYSVLLWGGWDGSGRCGLVAVMAGGECWVWVFFYVGEMVLWGGCGGVFGAEGEHAVLWGSESACVCLWRGWFKRCLAEARVAHVRGEKLLGVGESQVV